MGYFIALEGIDGSGTTTQCRALADALAARGHRVTTTREPSPGPIGRLVRASLAADAREIGPAPLALLFAADRLQHVEQEIEPALRRGEVVVCDRYVLSSFAYQSLDCDPAWVRAINGRARWPDLTLVLELGADRAIERVAAREAATATVRERFDVPEMQRRLAASYRELCSDPTLPHVLRIDAAPPPDEVTRALLEACMRAGL
jgi:dTMP kinase